MFSDALRALGLDSIDITEKAVKQAYATKLKQLKPDDNPQEFMSLRQAFEQVRAVVRHRAATEGDVAGDAWQEAGGPPAGETIVDPPLAKPVPAPETSRPELPPYIAPNPVAVAMAKIDEMVLHPWRGMRLENWIEVLESDDLQSIDDLRTFDEELRTFICTQSGMGKLRSPVSRPWMTERLMALLDQRFGWTRQTGRDFFERAEIEWLLMLHDNYAYFQLQSKSASAAWQQHPKQVDFVEPPFAPAAEIDPERQFYWLCGLYGVFNAVAELLAGKGIAAALTVGLVLGAIVGLGFGGIVEKLWNFCFRKGGDIAKVVYMVAAIYLVGRRVFPQLNRLFIQIAS